MFCFFTLWSGIAALSAAAWRKSVNILDSWSLHPFGFFHNADTQNHKGKQGIGSWCFLQEENAPERLVLVFHTVTVFNHTRPVFHHETELTPLKNSRKTDQGSNVTKYWKGGLEVKQNILVSSVSCGKRWAAVVGKAALLGLLWPEKRGEKKVIRNSDWIPFIALV